MPTPKTVLCKVCNIAPGEKTGAGEFYVGWSRGGVAKGAIRGIGYICTSFFQSLLLV